MKVDILSEDRLGITQEMLQIIYKHGWNLAALEMFTHHTFAFIDDNVSFQQIKSAMVTIKGVKDVTQVEWLPSERKRKHLDALMGKLPDPIIDINQHGDILVTNAAANQLFGMTRDFLEGKNLTKLIACDLSQILCQNPINIEVNCQGKQHILDITPVLTGNTVTGAVLIFQSMQRIGQKISAFQTGEAETNDSFVATCEKMKQLQKQSRRFAMLDLPVLIRGETGTGKELLAKSLHDHGTRKNAPFLAINCAALPENLLESELFGYASGAFSGAKKNGKPGLMELADGGTVFLDEIGEMSIYLQAKLLRFLQDFTFRRIGGTIEIKVDIRIVCATHRNLEKMAQEGSFREDLFYRLNVLNLNLPPLRERIDDIPALVTLFAKNATTQLDGEKPSFTAEAMEKLTRHAWPGNIRQLQNVIFRTLALADNPTVTADQLHFTAQTTGANNQPLNFNAFDTLESAVEAFEKSLLKSLYVHYPSTRKLAKRLGVSHAKISRKLNRYSIN